MTEGMLLGYDAQPTGMPDLDGRPPQRSADGGSRSGRASWSAIIVGG
jgi:hypothetical protein